MNINLDRQRYCVSLRNHRLNVKITITSPDSDVITGLALFLVRCSHDLSTRGSWIPTPVRTSKLFIKFTKSFRKKDYILKKPIELSKQFSVIYEVLIHTKFAGTTAKAH